MTGPAYTEFNLTYPPLPFDDSGVAFLDTTQSYDTSKIPGILAGLLIPHFVCTVFVVARVWSRLFLLRKWFLDDTLIVAAWVFSTAVCAVYSVATLTPNIHDTVVLSSDIMGGGPADYPDDSPIGSYMLRTYLGLIFYQLCLCLTKLSILAFYLRMFSSRPVERRLAQGTVVLVLLYGAPLLVMSILQCHPSPGLFFGHPVGKCFSFVPLLIASASLHAATDAWLVIMVAPCIARLDLPPRQKAALAAVLSLSVLVVAASMTRLQLSLHSNYRPSGAGVQVANTLAFFVMTVLECDVALMCACAPTLRPVLARLWPRLGMDDHSQYPQYHHHRRRQQRRRRRSGRRGETADGDEDGSVNLTEVSYHGYPWTQPHTTGGAAGGLGIRSKNRSNSAPDLDAGVDVTDMAMPTPPVPAFMQRTPTTLSLRSFMSSIAPRSRGGGGGATVSGARDAGEDRAVLLKGGEGGDDDEGGGAAERRSSVGFEGYHDQYLGYGEERRRSRPLRKSLVIGAGPWGDSQESFVMGMNDPASPTRMSPVSDLSGATYPVFSSETREVREMRNGAGVGRPNEKETGTNDS
ncbi:hypothetical protein QBC33DRAFT_198131 [Phialemonium atrogriseum]|uniref:Rhodopsin domain-containing protein n=1 Tax=Phialemonium atrogriseum TaxID=1093897 RepID=A0AAJ0FKT2_9PEZI|nr:uncharacterized protein QBC33DRAFT_198131 [Phialemonium atrogriseum]KAK1764400.1 hypothetical protein QBC33DRAFT_198131 [Phialemonium atrogriseum]